MAEALAGIRVVESLAGLRAYAKDPRATVYRAVDKRRLAIKEENLRLRRLMREERRLYHQGVELVAGVDEVGAGPLAGPVVAAAVILPKGLTIPGVDDSKKISRRRRPLLAQLIRENALAFSFGHCSPAEIDILNIFQASREAMRRAVCGLGLAPQAVLVDARDIPGIAVPQRAVVGGDRLSHSIAAASILAKVERDELMSALEQRYPGYGFSQNNGYGTAAHMRALGSLGPCAIHRRTFAPVVHAAGGAADRPPSREV